MVSSEMTNQSTGSVVEVKISSVMLLPWWCNIQQLKKPKQEDNGVIMAPPIPTPMAMD